MNEPYFITRADLMAVFPARAARQFETMQERVAENDSIVTANVEQTTQVQDATFLTLSANASLPNERVLQLGPGLKFEIGPDRASLLLDGVPRTTGEFALQFVTEGDSELAVPLTGRLATTENAELLSNKTLAAPRLQGLANAADDAAAATAGVPVGGVYRNGSALMIRAA